MNDDYLNTPVRYYDVTFHTADPVAYEVVKKFCWQMSGELKPNESKYELRTHAHWVGIHGTFVPIDEYGAPIEAAFCSHCNKMLVGSDEYFAIGRYCPNCGAKMDEEEVEDE